MLVLFTPKQVILSVTSCDWVQSLLTAHNESVPLASFVVSRHSHYVFKLSDPVFQIISRIQKKNLQMCQD